VNKFLAIYDGNNFKITGKYPDLTTRLKRDLSRSFFENLIKAAFDGRGFIKTAKALKASKKKFGIDDTTHNS
jgi:hypothetical protein